MTQFNDDIKKIIAMANSFSSKYDLHDTDNVNRLSLMVIKETLKIVGGKIVFIQDEIQASNKEVE
jgi:hypothetical protein